MVALEELGKRRHDSTQAFGGGGIGAQPTSVCGGTGGASKGRLLRQGAAEGRLLRQGLIIEFAPNLGGARFAPNQGGARSHCWKNKFLPHRGFGFGGHPP